MIRLKDFSIGYSSRTLLREVDTSFSEGTLTALIGRNGTGKSTLLRAIAGLNSRYGGQIIIGGRELRSMPPGYLARIVAFVSTERTRIPNMSVEDAVAMGRAPYTNWIGRMQEQDRKAVGEALEATGMRAFAKRTLAGMSDGECQRVMIARALAQDTPAIILDEPTSFLDIPSRRELCTILRSLARDKGKCILFSTHELDLATEFAASIALIDTPALIHEATPAFIASGAISRIFSTEV